MSLDRSQTTPRHYAPGRPREDPSRLVRVWSQTEILIGSALAMVGGFVLRGGGGYDTIVVGSSMILLGLFHLVRISGPSRSDGVDSPVSRLIIRLDQDLDAHYTLARDYPAGPAERIDLLVIGPGGWFGIELLDAKGTVDGTVEDDTWRRTPPGEEPDGDAAETIPNPVRALERKLATLTERIPEEIRDGLSPEPLVVPRYHRTGGSALEGAAVCGWNELGERIRRDENTEHRLTTHQVENLESGLNLSDYN